MRPRVGIHTLIHAKLGRMPHTGVLSGSTALNGMAEVSGSVALLTGC